MQDKFMDWEECTGNFVRNVQIDFNKIKSILKAAEAREEALKILEQHKESISFVIEGYYEVVKELLVALLLSKGMKSSNHQCLITYFYKNYPEHESYSHLIAEMSYLRNRLGYYGEMIDPAFYEKNQEKIKKIISILKDLLNKG